MLRVPHDLEAQFGAQTVRVAEACVVRYRAIDTVLSQPALVTQPTFVMVRSGSKQLQPQAGRHLLTAPTGSILAMRSGTHIMSEFHGEHGDYESLIVSVDRSFVSQAVGIPQAAPDGPRVVVWSPNAHAQQLFRELPDALATAPPGIEQQFKLRELLVAIMSDPGVRRLVFREVADWGNTLEERIVSVVTSHCLTPLQVPDLASLCAMSLSSFKRHFRSIYGTTPGKWLSKSRLGYARSMVLGGNAPVSEICAASGYHDVSAFIRAFRREFGAPPRSLRREGVR